MLFAALLLKKRLKSCLLLASSAAALCATTGNALAESLADEAAEAADSGRDTIIVTGTRRAERTLADSSVPVDVVSGEALTGSTPSPDLNDKLARLVPSFNVQRLPMFDGAAFVRPATLRGLSPDQTLVLINGKRRHRSAYISILQHGEQAVDLAQIPQISLGRVEVLRDGASAQYGSDAIAGVINLLLDETTGYRVAGQIGQYYKGDGETYQLEGRAGLALGDRGVLAISGEYSSLGETDRGGAVQKIGQPGVKSWKIFANGKYKLTDGIELYGFGNVNRTRSRNEFNFRSYDPANNNVSNVYQRSYFQDHTPFIFPTFNLSSVYPNGFIPIFASTSRDSSLVAGLRGELSDSFNWDVSGRYGRNRIGYDIWNSINATLGPLSPTAFDAGSQTQTEYAANADFTWQLEAGLYRPINISFGGEWRRERYTIAVGDQASYQVGPLNDLVSGSNGYVSPTPDQAGTWTRDSRAAYADVDVDLTERFNLGGALRFEDFDDFGSTWNYKISSRYKLADWLNLRAAYSTGFHAPTVGQQNLTSTNQSPDPNQPPPAPQVIQTSGIIPSTSPIAQVLGGKPLIPEKSKSISAGFVLSPADGLTLSVDYYRIKISNRLGLTSTQSLTPQQRAALIAAGVGQASQLANLRFFINGFATRTQGVDVVTSYETKLGGGRLSLTAAYNYNKSKVTSGDPKLVTDVVVQEAEYRLPHHTANIGADYQIGRFGVSARARYYSAFIDPLPYLPAFLNKQYGSYGGEAFFDLAVSYQVTDAVKLTVGGENLFDNYPGRNVGPLAAFGQRYPLYRPYDADGGRYYARVSASF